MVHKSLPVLAFLSLMALGFPAGAMEPAQEGVPAYVVRAYDEAWSRFFGSPAPLPRDLRVPPELDPEAAFATLWNLCEPALLAQERPAARDALRLKVLGDEVPTLREMVGVLGRGRIVPADYQGALIYRFLDETVTDPEFLPEVLPPSASTMKLRSALGARQVSQPEFAGLFAAWLLARGLEAGLLEGSALDAPSVWALDRGLPGGGFALASLPNPLAGGWLAFEAVGDFNRPLRLVTLSAGADGRVTSALSPLSPGRAAIPPCGDRIWVAVVNPGPGPLGPGGLALTFWTSWEPLVRVREATLDGATFDLLLDESGGLAGYGIWLDPDGDEGDSHPLVDEFPSEGPGLHRYRLLLRGGPPGEGSFRLVGRAFTGGTVDVELRPGGAGRTPAAP